MSVFIKERNINPAAVVCDYREFSVALGSSVSLVRLICEVVVCLSWLLRFFSTQSSLGENSPLLHISHPVLSIEPDY